MISVFLYLICKNVHYFYPFHSVKFAVYNVFNLVFKNLVSFRRFYDDDEPIVAAPRTKVADDDDTDDFIRSLKQKTSRKPMDDILRDIERDSSPVPKFEPIPKFKEQIYFNNYFLYNKYNTIR